MAGFINDLKIDAIGNRRFKLISCLLFASNVAHCPITVPTGFVTDLLSTWKIPFAAEIFDGDYQASGALHDYIYSSRMFSRAKCDAILREAVRSQGAPRWKAWVIWAGVRIGGASYY